jgi:predicted AAA+ superfamily ATPase
MESIQTLAGFSNQYKFVLTGSNLENIVVKNAATGRKNYFDLYPITFREFLENQADKKLLGYFNECSPFKNNFSDYYDRQLQEKLDIYIRLGGLPKILSAYFDGELDEIPNLMKDLAVSIEENVKTILGEKSKLYEYEDVLRKLAFHSMNTLKLTILQVNHAGRQEAKKILSKTVGARVAHKIRLWEDENDLSKYVLFDCGLVNYLFGGSDLLNTQLGDRERAILSETFVACEIIAHLISREDLLYWKSGNRAELEFILRAPKMTGIDVKVKKGNHKSLNSFALLEPKATCLVKIGALALGLEEGYIAKLPNYDGKRKISFLSLTTSLTSRLLEFLSFSDECTHS